MASAFGRYNPPPFRIPSTGQPARPDPPPVLEAQADHAEKLTGNIALLFNNTNYSDAKIDIHDVILPVHKSIVCIQSDYFAKAFRQEFVEGDTGVIKFRQGDGAAYWRVFEYLYTGDYAEKLSTEKFAVIDNDALLIEPCVYALADMFFLEDLKALCVLKLRTKLKELWTSDEFPACIQKVYASTSDTNCEMRFAVLESATTHAHDLSAKEGFRNLLREGGDFTVEYVNALNRKHAR
ncbi:hypothetical protein C7974DRAFT_77384 [Boeremia exigua]|uniref:uncharacterized protein n=1 Tax=Boeremia exigua TaxID=749465 RepID=UPI001E8CA66B|nr:uncharacterized protein C7974DRAFT_77384 [Boeremia exigua]KAH6612379.1 hypothetical protein C7974DRAFT_77384 [Boeremia exigua]